MMAADRQPSRRQVGVVISTIKPKKNQKIKYDVHEWSGYEPCG